MVRVLKQLHPEASVTLYINKDNEGAGDYYWGRWCMNAPRPEGLR